MLLFKLGNFSTVQYEKLRNLSIYKNELQKRLCSRFTSEPLNVQRQAMPYLNRLDKQMVPLGRNLILAAHDLSKFDEMLFQMGKSEVRKNRVFFEAGKFRKNAAQENYKR